MAWQSQTLDSPLRSLAHTQSLRAHHSVAINKTFAGFSYQTAATPRFLVGKTRTQPTAPLPLPLAPRGGAAGQGGFVPPPLLRGSARAVTPSERSPRRRPEPPRGRSRASRPTTSAAGSARRRAPQPPGRASQVWPQAPLLPCRHCASFGCFLDRRALVLALGFVMSSHMFLISFRGTNAGGPGGILPRVLALLVLLAFFSWLGP